MNSQNNEEILIRRYFGNRKGTFLDIGANDGRTLSNVYACAKRGWSGVCVEPSPQAFTRLTANMSIFGERVQCVNVAVSDKAGTMTLHESGEHLNKGDIALLSTLHEAHAHIWTEQFTPVDVPVVTFGGLMALSDHKTFDLVSIDAEGADLDILRQMDLTVLGVKMLIIEHEHGDRDAMVKYCTDAGMKLSASNRQNLIFVA
jgi:FkbM family methyltransferase